MEVAAASGSYRNAFFVVRHRSDRERFRKSMVRKAMTALVEFVRSTPGEAVPEIAEVEESVWGSEWGSEGSLDDFDADSGEEEDVDEADLESRRGQCYALAPYCDITSWRGRMIVNPIPLNNLCHELCLPSALVATWVRATELEPEDPILDFFVRGEGDVTPRPDPFFTLLGDAGSILLTRAAQRWLYDLAEGFSHTLRAWGDARAGVDEADCWLDEEDEAARRDVVAWCDQRRDEWARRFKRYLGNPDKLPWATGGGEEKHGKAKDKQDKRGKHIDNLEKKLRTKKGKANLVRRTKKQKDKDRLRRGECDSSHGSEEDSDAISFSD